MSIVIYYLSPEDQLVHGVLYEDAQFAEATDKLKSLRDGGFHHVSMSNEPSNMVGKLGVTSVENGMTPDGHTYDWKKRR